VRRHELGRAVLLWGDHFDVVNDDIVIDLWGERPPQGQSKSPNVYDQQFYYTGHR
jgi:hypothetical protein